MNKEGLPHARMLEWMLEWGVRGEPAVAANRPCAHPRRMGLSAFSVLTAWELRAIGWRGEASGWQGWSWMRYSSERLPTKNLSQGGNVDRAQRGRSHITSVFFALRHSDITNCMTALTVVIPVRLRVQLIQCGPHDLTCSRMRKLALESKSNRVKIEIDDSSSIG
jgi:hypothetical protein